MTITKRSTRQRRGLMLIELALAATLLGLITGTVATLVLTWNIQLHDLEQRQRADRELQRLHLALASDLLGASAAEVTEPVLRIHHGNRRQIVYRLEQDRVERQVYSENALQQRDTFHAGPLRELEWRRTAGTTRNCVILSGIRGSQEGAPVSELLVVCWEAPR